MTTPLPTRRLTHWYAVVEAIARRLEREELIERKPYEVELGHHFDLCKYCEGRQCLAVLDWSWDRHDSTTDGTAQSCPKWSCVRAVLSEAEQDSEPENIVAEYPQLAAPVYAEAAAA